jgi:hypothetical protein
MRFEMRTSSFKVAIPALAVAAILAVAPLQLGSPQALGFPQAMAASHGGNFGHVGGNIAVGHVAGSFAGTLGVGFAGTTSATGLHQGIAQGSGNTVPGANGETYSSQAR